MPLRGPLLDARRFSGLAGIPRESIRIEGRREGDPFGGIVGLVDHFVLAADAPPVPFLVTKVLAQDIGSRIFEIAVDQFGRQSVRGIRDGPRRAGRLGFGGLDGVLPAALVRRDAAGRLVGVLVVVQTVRLVEHDVVQQVAVVKVSGADAPEREAGHGLARGNQIRALVGLPLGIMVTIVLTRVRDFRGDDV